MFDAQFCRGEHSQPQASAPGFEVREQAKLPAARESHRASSAWELCVSQQFQSPPVCFRCRYWSCSRTTRLFFQRESALSAEWLDREPGIRACAGFEEERTSQAGDSASPVLFRWPTSSVTFRLRVDVWGTAEKSVSNIG
jgi:hypothetical protein